MTDRQILEALAAFTLVMFGLTGGIMWTNYKRIGLLERRSRRDE